MVKRITAIFIICSLLFITASRVFSQGTEYMRLRSGSVAGGESPISGAPIVEYFIAPDDEMDILVWQNPDLTKRVIVGPDGYISYPLLGRIKIVGLSISQLEEMLTKKFSDYIRNPQVSVMMTRFAGHQIILLGELNYTGIYTYKGTINLIQAIALAGGFTGGARSDSVLVIRGNLTEKVEVMRINMTRVIKKGTIDPRIILQPNDLIYVPKTFVAHLMKFIGDLRPVIDGAQATLDMRKRIMDIRGKEER